MSMWCPYCQVNPVKNEHLPYCPTQTQGEDRERLIQQLRDREAKQIIDELERWISKG